jgi:hypothetical protein
MRLAIFCAAACIVTASTATSSEYPAEPAKVTSSDLAASALENSASALAEESKKSLDLGLPFPETKQSAPKSKSALCDAAIAVAKANKLPTSFFTRLIQQESGFKPGVVSRAGAQGIAQFMPGTASSRGLADPFEPIGALAASAEFLAELVSQFGNLGLAAAAYNAGPRRVQNWIGRGGKLPSETRHYVYRITGHPAEAWAGNRFPIALMSYASCPDDGNLIVNAQAQSNKGEVLAPTKTAIAIGVEPSFPLLPRHSGMGLVNWICLHKRCIAVGHSTPRRSKPFSVMLTNAELLDKSAHSSTRNTNRNRSGVRGICSHVKCIAVGHSTPTRSTPASGRVASTRS